MKKLIFLFLIILLAVLPLAACGEENGENQNGQSENNGDNTNSGTVPHSHSFVNGKCECGEVDPDYEPPHSHSFVNGKCECGEVDPNHEPPHSHNFVNGKCECGEVDPNHEPPHSHSFVNGKCECGEVDPNYEPDYGSATVYEKGSTVYLVSADDERSLIVPFIGALSELDINVSVSVDGEKRNEIIVGNSKARAASTAAYALLEKMPKSSYFNARYLVYSSGGKIAIAYDFNEYTPISALEYITDTLVNSIIGDGDFVALPEGVVCSGYVDLISEQKKLDEAELEVAWAKVKSQTSAEIYEAFRTLYTIYDDKLIEWYANLYDPNVGAYYETASRKAKEGYLPEPEATVQAMRFLENSGMLNGLGKYQDNVPLLMRYSIVYYCKSIQDPNGYFYDPQYSKNTSNGRDLSWCTNMLSLFGSAPVYDTPNGYSGDGITADEYWDGLVASGLVSEDTLRPLNLAKMKEENGNGKLTASLGADVSEAVSNIILTATTSDYLSDYIAYIDYLNSIDVDANPYVGCGVMNSIYTQVKVQSDVLFKKQGAFVFEESMGEKYRMYDGMNLKEITIAYYSSKINPETGMCGKPSSLNPRGTEYIFTNGFFKIIPVYNSFGVAYPAAEAAAETLLLGIVSDEATTQNICDVYNVWAALSDLKSNIKKYADAKTRTTVLALIDEGISEKGAEAILKSYEKMEKYKMTDGGFASSTLATESNVDAIGKPTSGMVAPMFSLVGAERVPMYTRYQLMQYFDILLSLERTEKVYFKPLAKVLTFEDMPDTSQLYLNSATAELSIEAGKGGDPALLINKNVNKNQTIVDITLMDEVKNPTGIIFETDIKISNVINSNPIAISFGPRGGGHANRAYRFHFDFKAAEGSAIAMQEVQWSGSGSTFNRIGSFSTPAKVGEWFNLRIEYDTDDLSATGSPETRVYINDTLVYVTTQVYSATMAADDTSATATVIMFTPVLCEVWLDNTTVKQIE